MMPETTSTARKSIASLRTRLILGVVSLIAATAIWLPCLHFVYWRPIPPPKEESEVEPLASRLAAQQLYLWTDAESRPWELAKMRSSNAEWDFMGRSFLVWALANRSLRHPEQKTACLEVMDRIIEETLKTEQERGMFHFLMPYARNRPFVMQPPRSLFLDGEIAMMLASRRLVATKESYREPLRQRVEEMVRRMEAGPVLCAESCPDECWMFCNSAADQYRRARKELGRELLGFGYAREWPVSWVGQEDVDSGPVVPVLGVSAGSSGLAFLGARAFDDRA